MQCQLERERDFFHASMEYFVRLFVC
ncbi:Hypothetical protein J6891_04931 [Nakaseomyces glabratus]|nr:hypothetical protein J7298_04932 [Nakaseomyces glabratus]KAH7592713.1 hypothetical protein J7295_04926 [Nakaseomyces glabratus]KAH7610558.1 hypothetical protein J7292_04903 [Nakaseomyces glabratus]